MKIKTINWCFCIYDEKREKYKTILTETEDIELNALPVYDNRCIKTKIKTYRDKVYTNFCGLNVPEDDKNMNLK